MSGFVKYLAQQAEARETVRTFLSIKPDGKTWRGLLATPPGSALQTILSSFRTETDMPLELPFFSFIHSVSQLLMSKGVVVKGSIGTQHMELWTIVLAPSGSGKTLAYEIVSKAAPVNYHFPEPASGAAFIQALAENPTTHWAQDEFGQKLKQIEQSGSPMSDCKDYLLRVYSNAKIERKTKHEIITVDDPVLGILGFNVGETFLNTLSAESLVDGFGQRFGYVWAERDESRPWQKYPIYNKQRLGKACDEAWAKIEGNTIHPVYDLCPTAESAFAEAFTLLGHQDAAANPSFFRRAMFRAFKYAVIYHVILGKENNIIDAEDIGWAARLCHLHINDMGKVLRQKPEIKNTDTMMDKAKKVKEKADAAGKPLTARMLQQSIRGLNSAEEAQVILALITD
ncbi:MAG: hypothetical protein M3Q42_15365 [Pseudomonadota bacterium]|nr:hypothetical protein [Pseudomonadota bacterium]